MATESAILATYLLLPSALPSILSLEQFKAFFPRALHSSPQVQSLYRDLQSQRAAILDLVAHNIAEEEGRGEGMRREVLRQRRAEGGEEGDGEIEMERALFGDGSGVTKTKHSITSVVPELDGAVGALEAELARLEEEEGLLTRELEHIVGGLSDLRYGKMANGKLKDDILDGLAALQETCESKP